MKEEKEKPFVDKELIRLLSERNFSEKCIIGVILLTRTEEKQRILKKYVAFKGKYLTASDLLGYAKRLKGEKPKYYPPNMYVKYIGKSDSHLKNGSYYRVGIVFGIAEDEYLVELEGDDRIICKSNNFEQSIPTKIYYTGLEKKNGEIETEDGFEIGKEYEIEEYLGNGIDYIVNGKKCRCFFVEPTVFKKKPPVEKRAITQKEAVNAVMRAIEFKDIKSLYQMLDESSVYNSFSVGRYIRGRDDIIEYFENIADNMLEKEVFADCYYQEDTDEETEDTFYIEYSYNDSDKCKVAINDKYITRITIGNG